MSVIQKSAPSLSEKVTSVLTKDAQDPAKQRAQAGLKAHRWLCAGILYAQLMVYANLRLVDGAGSAAWWAMPLGLIGGFAVWLPTAYLCRLRAEEGLCGAVRWGLGNIGGGLVCALLGLVLFMDAVTLLYAMVDLCASYLLQEVDVRFLGIATAMVLVTMLVRGGTTAASRSLFRQRFRLMLAFTALAVFFFTEARIVNLFPIGGFGVLKSVGEGLMTGSALNSVFVLGFITPITQGAPRVSARDGTKVLLGIGVFCEMMQLAVSMSTPYAVALYKEDWALRLMGSVDYIGQWGLLKMVFVVARVAILTQAAQGLLAYSGHALANIRPGIKAGWAQGVLGALLLAAALYITPTAEAMLIRWMPWRLPMVMLPLWLACGAGALRKRKEGASA